MKKFFLALAAILQLATATVGATTPANATYSPHDAGGDK